MFPPQLLSPAKTLLLFGDSLSWWEGTGLCWEVTASRGGATVGGTSPGYCGIRVAAPPTCPPACSWLILPHCCQEPLFLLWPPMSWLVHYWHPSLRLGRGSTSQAQAQAPGYVLPGDPQYRLFCCLSARGHGAAGYSSVAEPPPGPLAPELMPAGEVSLGTGIPGGRCEVQPGSCQYILRED